MSETGGPRLASPPGRADVCVLMALPIEAGHFSDRLRKVRKYSARALTITEGELAGKLVVLAVSGMGRAAARRAIETLIAGHHPRRIISAGFAGALAPELALGDLVLPHEVCDPEGAVIPIERVVPAIAGVQFMEGRLLTIDRIVTLAAEKSELRAAHRADLVDMETSAVAELAGERGLAFTSVRVVSDDAETELPAEVARLLTHSGSYRLGAAMRAVWSRPSVLKDFVALHAKAMSVSDRLASCLERVLEHMAGT